MLGPPKRRILDRPVSVSVSLEDLDPANHFNRHRDAILDLSVMRDWVVERYADRGRPSIDPVVFIRFHLIIFLEGIRSERQLVETASLNVAHRWYLGDHFDEPLPDRSSLIKIVSDSGSRSIEAVALEDEKAVLVRRGHGRLGQRRLADTGFAADQHQAALTIPRARTA